MCGVRRPDGRYADRRQLGPPSQGLASVRLTGSARIGTRVRVPIASLLAEELSWASAHDFQLKLDVVEDGAPAIRLYERMRWRLVERRQSDWVTPQGERLPVRIYLAPDDE